MISEGGYEMAMRDCIYCGSSISDSAQKCPRCGKERPTDYEQISALQEVREVLRALDEAEHRFQTEAFKMVRHEIEESMIKNPDALVQMIRKTVGWTPLEWVYSQIGNIAGHILESGEYHIYTGVLNPMGPGKDLLKMFDAAYDELVRMKAVDADYANEQKVALRRNIQAIGTGAA
jgi:hypothetical protein